MSYVDVKYCSRKMYVAYMHSWVRNFLFCDRDHLKHNDPNLYVHWWAKNRKASTTAI